MADTDNKGTTGCTGYDSFIDEWHNDSPLIVAHTSGSTGTPKAIRLLKDDMRASARATNRFFGLGEGAVFVVPLSMNYIAAKMMAVRADVSGGYCVALSPANEFKLPDGAIDLLAIVPSQVDCLLRHSQWASRVHNIIIGGAPLSDALRKRLVHSGFNAYETYGMTETCSHVALKRIGQDFFAAVPGVLFSVDERGCLVVDVEHFAGERHFVTNDIVELVDRRHFRWLGRYDNVINSGGIKIVPEQLEERIRALVPDIDFEFIVTGRPSERWGQEVIVKAETGQCHLDEVFGPLRELLPHTHLPKAFIAVTALPRTANGKLRR